MATLIGDIALLIAALSALTFLASLVVCKRTDLTWSAFLAAGPLILLRPRRYLEDEFAHIPPILFFITMSMFAVAWVGGWFANNA